MLLLPTYTAEGDLPWVISTAECVRPEWDCWSVFALTILQAQPVHGALAKASGSLGKVQDSREVFLINHMKKLHFLRNINIEFSMELSVLVSP